MSTLGWIIMLLSVGGVTLLLGWCIYRVLLHKPPADTTHMHGMDIDTKDTEGE